MPDPDQVSAGEVEAYLAATLRVEDGAAAGTRARQRAEGLPDIEVSSLQAKLLRVLQEREVTPVGATDARAVDLRVVACANRDLRAEVAAGRFRADLYYRLSVFPIATRPLVERPGDLLALVAALLVRHTAGRARFAWPTDDALAKLRAHAWPGNVRELDNVLQRALVLCDGDAIDVIVKGLRSGADYDYELAMAQMNRKLTGVDTAFLPTAPELAYVSSSLVREVASLGGDVAPFVTPAVLARIAARLQERADH